MSQQQQRRPLPSSSAQVAPVEQHQQQQREETSVSSNKKGGRLARFKRSSTMGTATGAAACSGSLQDLKAQHLQHQHQQQQQRPMSSSVLTGARMQQQQQHERSQLLLLAQNQHVQQEQHQQQVPSTSGRMQFSTMQLDYGANQVPLHHQQGPIYLQHHAASTSQMSKGHTTDSSSLALSSEQCADGEHEDRPSCVHIMKKLFFSLVLGTIIAICWVMIIHTLKWIAIKGNEFELVSQQQQQQHQIQLQQQQQQLHSPHSHSLHQHQHRAATSSSNVQLVLAPPILNLQQSSSSRSPQLSAHKEPSSFAPFNHASTPSGNGNGGGGTGSQSPARAALLLENAGDQRRRRRRQRPVEGRVTRQLTSDSSSSGGSDDSQDGDDDDGSSSSGNRNTADNDRDSRHDNNNNHQATGHGRTTAHKPAASATTSETTNADSRLRQIAAPTASQLRPPPLLSSARYPKQQQQPTSGQLAPPRLDSELDDAGSVEPAVASDGSKLLVSSIGGGDIINNNNNNVDQEDGNLANANGGLAASPLESRGLTTASLVSYRAPFFTSWFVSIWNILFMPVFTLISSCCFRSEDSTTKKLLVESISQFMDNGLTTLQFLGRCAFFSVLWIATIFGIVYSLSNIDATVVMALFACSATLVYLLSWVLLHQQFVGVRIVAVIICTTGIALLAYMDNSRTLGSVLIVAGSALCSAVYKVIYQRMFGFWSIAQMSLFFTLIGLFNAFLMWPVALMLYFLGVELIVWRYIPWMHLTAAGALHLTANIVAYFGPICSYDIFLTMGLLLAVALSAVIDVTFYKITFFGMKLAGVLLLMVGFLVCLLPENWNEFLYDLVNERFVRWKKQRNLKKSRNKVQDLSTGQMSRLRTPSGRVK